MILGNLFFSPLATSRISHQQLDNDYTSSWNMK
jgi:hypothetical protein